MGFLSQKQNALTFSVRILVGKTDVFRMINSWYKRKKLHQNLTFIWIRKNSSYAINVHQMNGLSRISIQIEKQALESSRPWRLVPNIRSIYLYWMKMHFCLNDYNRVTRLVLYSVPLGLCDSDTYLILTVTLKISARSGFVI